MRALLVLAIALGCAKGESRGQTAATPTLQSGASAACAGLDEGACRSAAACFWYVDTEPCQLSQPCPPDHCIDRAQGSFDPRMACGCALGPGSQPGVAYACVRESGATALVCEPVPAGCTPPSLAGTDQQTAAACACLSVGGRSCRAATDIRALCDCS